MYNIEVLLSTMNREDYSFLNSLNLQTSSVIINQTNKNEELIINNQGRNHKVLCFDEIGLSKSRNKAIKASEADICILADDDITYVDNYAKIVNKYHELYKDVDIIAFIVDRKGGTKPKKFRKNISEENYFTCLKISSVEITFKREAIIKNNLVFNESMGAGSDFYLGEENIFLYDALKKGLRIMYVPHKIGEVDCSNSSWFEGYNQRFFNSLGAAYYNMSKKFFLLLILQYAMRKRSLYKYNISFSRAVIYMFQGILMYKRVKNK